MTRFEELKQKAKDKGGYLALTKEEQAEYSELKGKVEVKTEPTITMTKSELEKMMSDAIKNNETNKNVINGKLFGKWAEFKEVDTQNQTATLKLWQPTMDKEAKLIIAQDYLRNDLDEATRTNTKLIYRIRTLDSKGNEESVEADSVTLSAINQTERVEIIKNDRKKMLKTDGTVIVTPKDKKGYTVRRVDSNRYGNADSGFEVPLEVVKYREIFTCRRKSGQEFIINGIYLNS